MGVIWFDGQSSRDYGLVVESYPSLNHGVKRGEAYAIAGRNGTFYREDGTYDNYIQAYNVAVREGRFRRADLRAADIAAWLSGKTGFLRLEDSFEPEFFKLARYAGPLNIEQLLGVYGRCTLEFDCRPERWLLSGEETEAFKSTGDHYVYNPTNFEAKPLIKMTGTGALTLSINSQSWIKVGSGGSNTTVAIIDCETGTITDSDGDSLMSNVAFYTPYNSFPTLRPGSNKITTAAAITRLEITPRWWTL